MTINDENNHHPIYDKEPPYPYVPNYYHPYEQPPSPYVGGAPFLHYPPPSLPPTFTPPVPPLPPTIHKQTPAENKPTVRVYTKAKIDYSLTIRDGQVILAPTNPSDQYQHWIKDEKFGIDIKDEQGFSSFALINKATGQAMKHSIGVTYPVQLTEYNPDRLDKSLLWTQGKSLGDGYRPVRAVDNIHFLLDACEGIKDFGGVRDGTKVIIWEWNNGDNQRWTIASY